MNTTPEITAEGRPKCLWPVANRPCVEYSIQRLKAARASEFIFCLTGAHQSAERVLRELGQRHNITCILQENIRGTAGALKGVVDRLRGTFILAHSANAFDGDIRPMLAAHSEGGAIMTVGGVRPAAYPVYNESLQRDPSGRVTGLSTSHWSEQEPVSLYPCGLYVMEPECLDVIPDGRYFDVKEQLVPHLVETGRNILSYELDGYWREIHTLNDYFHLNMDVLVGYFRSPHATGIRALCEDVEKQGPVNVDESAHMVGPVALGEGCTVDAGAQVFGPCVIGRGAHVGAGSVVSNSVVLADAEIGVGAYVHGSILAEKAHVGDGERLLGVSLLRGGSRTIRQAAYPTLQPAAPAGARRKPLRRIMKRVFDVAFSSVALVFAAPVLALVYVAVRLTSGRPVVYKDYRCTVGGRRFAMLKFRTMVPDADQLRPDLQARNESDGPTFKVSNDPRTTRLGALLRKVSLDELPQLFNVLKGDMSLVGPRPLRMDEMQYHRAWRDQRLSVVPGVTGPWQVASDNTRFHTWIAEDVGYVQRNSFWRDVWILALTILKLGRHGPQTSPPTAGGQGQPVQDSDPDEAPTVPGPPVPRVRVRQARLRR